MSTTLSRRLFLQSALLAPAALTAAESAPSTPATPAIGLGFGTYGMKALTPEAALRTLAEIGYDGVELAVMTGWPSEPARLTPPDRRRLRELLSSLGLALPALCEALPMTGKPGTREANLERLKRTADLARDLAPAGAKPPVIETVLGLKTAEWESVKERMAEELREWGRVAEGAGVTVCFKAHAGQAVHTPERARWLLSQAASPALGLVYDYSHFSLAGLPLEGSFAELQSATRLIHVKDARGAAAKPEYLLPGDGATDYVAYFKMLAAHRYGGFVVVEVSSMIHGKPGYDAVDTARRCYERLAPALEQAGARRAKDK